MPSKVNFNRHILYALYSSTIGLYGLRHHIMIYYDDINHSNIDSTYTKKIRMANFRFCYTTKILNFNCIHKYGIRTLVLTYEQYQYAVQNKLIN